MEPQQRKRMMDMGPRRSMDMTRRPARPVPTVPAPAPQPQSAAPKPAPKPAPRPAAPVRPAAPQPVPAVRPRQAAAPEAAAPAHQPTESRGGGWRTALQVIIGLLVIAGVAGAIVVLYIRYYQ